MSINKFGSKKNEAVQQIDENPNYTNNSVPDNFRADVNQQQAGNNEFNPVFQAFKNRDNYNNTAVNNGGLQSGVDNKKNVVATNENDSGGNPVQRAMENKRNSTPNNVQPDEPAVQSAPSAAAQEVLSVFRKKS